MGQASKSDSSIVEQIKHQIQTHQISYMDQAPNSDSSISKRTQASNSEALNNIKNQVSKSDSTSL